MPIFQPQVQIQIQKEEMSVKHTRFAKPGISYNLEYFLTSCLILEGADKWVESKTIPTNNHHLVVHHYYHGLVVKYNAFGFKNSFLAL